MKKILIIIIPVFVLLGTISYILLISKPVNDNKKLYISCNNKNNTYKLSSGSSLLFSENDDKCKLSFNVSDVDRTFLKLKFDKYLYPLDGNGQINENDISHTFFVLPDETLILYSYDKKTKFELKYK